MDNNYNAGIRKFTVCNKRNLHFEYALVLVETVKTIMYSFFGSRLKLVTIIQFKSDYFYPLNNFHLQLIFIIKLIKIYVHKNMTLLNK